uniref:Protein kinase domain-containing protein n=1 Tax=Panagrolaimus superbus TaxID=310955 RepID=A0A914YAC5_9BILA
MAHFHPYVSPSRKPNNFKPKIPKGIENFKIGKELGSGAFSTVYFAQHKPTQTLVALKQVQLEDLDQKHYDCCVKEVELLNRINSENYV